MDCTPFQEKSNVGSIVSFAIDKLQYNEFEVMPKKVHEILLLLQFKLHVKSGIMPNQLGMSRKCKIFNALFVCTFASQCSMLNSHFLRMSIHHYHHHIHVLIFFPPLTISHSYILFCNF